MTGYSSIFSSGLLATPRPNRHATPQPDSPVNVDTDPDMTPTKLNSPLLPSSEEMIEYFMSRSRASSNASTTSSVLGSAPRLRRRRSSLSIANNGLAAVKSPQRNAGFALQRTALMVPAGRARSGSTDFGPASVPRADEGGYMPVLRRVGGRSRSGSTGGTLRSRRALRKPPPVPPPNMPLPPPPTSPTAMEVAPRRPFVHRAHTAEKFSPISAALGPDAASCTFPTPASLDFTNNLKVMAAMTTTPPSSSPMSELSAFRGPGAQTHEN